MDCIFELDEATDSAALFDAAPEIEILPFSCSLVKK